MAIVVVVAVVGLGYIIGSSRAAAVVGDINADGTVNILDLSILLSHWNASYAAADLNSDGTVNVFDLSTLLSHWGQTGTPSPTPSTAPNPSGSGNPSGSSYGNGALAQWFSALANRNTQPATLMFWGASIAEGQGSSTVDGRWTNQALNALRSAYPVSGVTGGFGYIPAFYGTYGPDSQWSTDPTLSGNAFQNTAPEDGGLTLGNGAGLGERTVTLNSGGSDTFNADGSSIDIMYNYGSGSFSYRVDSGSTVTVSASGSASSKPCSSSSIATCSTHVSFSSVGSHTVRITGVSGSVVLEGIMTYNGDETKGIHEYEGAQSGADSVEFASQATHMAQIAASVNTDLVIIAIANNDYDFSSATPTQTAANIKAMVSAIRAAGTAVGHVPSIAITHIIDVAGGNNSLGYPYSAYAAAVKSVATSDPTLGFLDLSFGCTDGIPCALTSSYDNTHPNDAGQAKLATLLEQYLEDK